MLKHVLDRLLSSHRREHQQAFIRVLILSIVFPYIWITHQDDPQVLGSLAIAATILFSISFSFIAWIYYRPQETPLRYVINTTVDISALSYGVYLAGEYGSALYPLYLLIMFGYGLRFGRFYLVYCAAISIIGFTVVRYFSQYWQEHTILFGSLTLGMVFLPTFVFTLIHYLEEAIEEAKLANQAKSQFLANMFHELRTPLNGIMGSNELLKTTRIEAERKEYTDTIDYSVNTLLSLIDNILDISKIEAGKIDIKNNEFDLHSMLYQTIKMLTHVAYEKGLELKLHVNPDVPFALIGDHDHVRQILVNLIGNAIKFTEEGYVKVDVSLAERDVENCVIRYEVSDSGPGINKADQEKIFERFNQADNSDTRKYSGTGLGTTIAKELIELLGGKIAIDSTPGEGSTFWFEIPFQAQKNNIDAKADLQKANIILLHDNDNISEDLLETFCMWGINVYSTESVNDAIATIQHANEKYDNKNHIHSIVITKSILEFNPEGLMSQLRSEQKKETANTIFVSDKFGEHTIQTLLGSGYDYVLSIDVDKSQIYNAIHSSPLLNIEQSNVESIFNHKTKSASQKYNILLAEDNQINQRIISRLLEQGGHTVDITENGEKALNLLNQNNYDLCIFDMQMPVMGGVEAINLYKENNPGSEIPFIVLSANATRDAIDTCQAAGASMYLTKPVRSSTLLSAVDSVTSQLTELGGTLNESSNDDYNDESSAALSADNYSLENHYEILPEIVTINLDQLNYLVDDPEEAKRLYKRFVAEMHKTINQLDSLKSNCYKEFKMVTHALKGLSGNIGLEKLYKVSSALDGISEEEYAATIDPYFDATIIEIHNAVYALWMFSEGMLEDDIYSQMLIE